MPKKLLLFVLCLLPFTGVFGKAGIKSIVVFGDSLSDSGNVPLWAVDHPVDPDLLYPSPPYYMGRGSNGPVWVEILAGAYGMSVAPGLAGGSNFAFAGAESGTGLSDQDSPNFRAQIRLWNRALQNETIRPPMPWQLFVVWFGPNDMLRYLVDTAMAGQLPTREGIDQTVTDAATQIAQGILSIHEKEGRLFLVPNMPPLHLTPWGLTQQAPLPAVLESMTNGFNTALERVLVRLENAHKDLTIIRLDTHAFMMDLIMYPENYGIGQSFLPALDISAGVLNGDPNVFLSWDGFHPTAVVHALLAQKAMDVIPIGSWWGHSVARGPGGKAVLGMGMVDDENWPWIYVYGQDGTGQWVWAIDQSGTLDGFLAYAPNGYKWIFVNARAGWYYDYSIGEWVPAPSP